MRCVLCGHSSHLHMVNVASPYCYDCGKTPSNSMLYHWFSSAPLTWELWPPATE